MRYKSGEDFLNHIYKHMYKDEVVSNHTSSNDSKEQIIKNYLERLENVHDIAKTKSHKMDVLKQFYYQKYVIKELPKQYINLQKRIAREEGYGDIDITDRKKKEMLDEIQGNQKKSLDVWIEYLSSDDAIYPMWFKTYAFYGMLTLGIFNKETNSFSKRTAETTTKFIELNPEVLSQVYDAISIEIGENEEVDEEIEIALSQGDSFKKLYQYYLSKIVDKKLSNETDGIWIKYDQGDNYYELYNSLQGKNTGWCTAGKKTCKNQLRDGDFYVYYTKDSNGDYTEPRVAIRMNGHTTIAEVRGIGKNQNMEDSMLDIVDKKLDEFKDKNNYLKKIHDMRKVTELEKKVNAGLELSKEDLIFIYEIESVIEGFGFRKDPRIEEITEKRDLVVDFATVFDCSKEQVSFSESDFDDPNKDIVVYMGNIQYNGEYVPKSYQHLRWVNGKFVARKLRSAKGLEQLETIGEIGAFPNLLDSFGLNSLRRIGKDAFFDKLQDARDLRNFEYAGGDACFHQLESATGLVNLRYIGEDAFFDHLQDAADLRNLNHIGSDAYFDELNCIEPLENCDKYDEIRGNLEKRIVVADDNASNEKRGKK